MRSECLHLGFSLLLDSEDDIDEFLKCQNYPQRIVYKKKQLLINGGMM